MSAPAQNHEQALLEMCAHVQSNCESDQKLAAGHARVHERRAAGRFVRAKREEPGRQEPALQAAAEERRQRAAAPKGRGALQKAPRAGKGPQSAPQVSSRHGDLLATARCRDAPLIEDRPQLPLLV